MVDVTSDKTPSGASFEALTRNAAAADVKSCPAADVPATVTANGIPSLLVHDTSHYIY